MSFFFSSTPAAVPGPRHLLGAHANDPVVDDRPRRRAPRTRAAVSRSLHRIADSVAGG